VRGELMRAAAFLLALAGCGSMTFGDRACLHTWHGRRALHYAIADQSADEDQFLLRMVEDPRARADAYAWDDLRETGETWGWAGWLLALGGSIGGAATIIGDQGRAPGLIAGVSIMGVTALAWPIVQGILDGAADRHLRRAVDRFNADAGEKCSMQ
jgi:hypothetical protein